MVALYSSLAGGLSQTRHKQAPTRAGNTLYQCKNCALSVKGSVGSCSIGVTVQNERSNALKLWRSEIQIATISCNSLKKSCTVLRRAAFELQNRKRNTRLLLQKSKRAARGQLKLVKLLTKLPKQVPQRTNKQNKVNCANVCKASSSECVHTKNMRACTTTR